MKFRYSPSLVMGVAAILVATAPATGAETTAVKRLNNFVTELTHQASWVAGKPMNVVFANPRTGWVFISITTAKGTSGEIGLRWDSGPVQGTLGELESLAARTREGMWWLPEGSCRFHLEPAVGTVIESITVRAVPELHYCRYPADPAVEEYGPYDWDYLKTYVLPNVNTVVGNPSEESDARITQWTQRGRKWIAYGSLPHDQGLTAQMAYDYWRNNPGFTDPRLSGLIADEFQGRQNAWYPAWIAAMRRLGEDSTLAGKSFYGYCGGPGMYTRPQTRELVQTVFQAGYYMAWERYLHEMPTLEEANALLESHLGEEMKKWRAAFPECQKQMVLVSGLFTHGLSLNVQPEVDYKVWMDMQMHYLATNPEFDGLFGLHWWNSQYADEETLRWMARLFRHYAIDGQTVLLSESLGFHYRPDLIVNADFEDGLNGWTVHAANENSLRTDYMERYARLQGRYWHRATFPDEPAGNTFLWVRRNADKPNVIAQTMRRLKPGALYSVKVMGADYEDIIHGVSEKKILPLSVKIENAEVIPGKCFVGYPNSRSSSPSNLPFDSQHPAWFNLHRIVFRATADTATLRIADWSTPTDPGAPAGQELMINDIEAQPYFDSQ